MITYGRPEQGTVERFLMSQISDELTYPNPGCTLGGAHAAPGYRRDRTEGLIGHGPAAFEHGRGAVRRWLMFDQPGIFVYPQDTPIVPGGHVVAAGSVGPLWIAGACRIVDVVDDDHRFGFAYGTLDHVACGEELFVVEMRPDGSVWFTIEVFSRPRRWYAILGAPLFRAFQHRFRQRAIARIAVAVRDSRITS